MNKMKKAILTFIALIGLYALLRDNIGILNGRIVWISNPELFQNTFIPILMFVSAIASLLNLKKLNLFLLAIGAMVIDAAFRLSVGINHLYLYQIYKTVPHLPPTPGTTTIIINLWPSHIMLFIEFILILLVGIWIKRENIFITSSSSRTE